jgi:hypothetical protein
MAYGTIKVNNITFDDGGSDQTVTVSGLYNAFTNDIAVTGTISGSVVIGSTSVSGTTVLGTTVTGTTVQGASGTFASLTGTTTTGTTANFTSGNFTSVNGVNAIFSKIDAFQLQSLSNLMLAFAQRGAEIGIPGQPLFGVGPAVTSTTPVGIGPHDYYPIDLLSASFM